MSFQGKNQDNYFCIAGTGFELHDVCPNREYQQLSTGEGFP
jgi:hypothetical protein